VALYYDLPVFNDTYRLTLTIFELTQHFSREYKFTLGQDMKRDCITLVRSIYRANKNFNRSLSFHNKLAADHKPDREELSAFISSVNSYLGILRHYKTYRKRRYIVRNHISSFLYKHITFSSMEFGKIIKRQRRK